MKKEFLKEQKIALVLSVFNTDISKKLKAGALDELKKQKVKNFKIVEVPGVVETPLASEWLFQKGFKAVIALGAVIRGETSHYSACCRLVEQGSMQVQLKYGRPLIFGVLMVDNKEQALARTGGKKGHIARSAVRSTLKMLKLKDKLNIK